ncbi:histidine ammonia-lyase-like [Lineus longissimus]|uniref:histidine ammonia-lyase-like n=1 Tax=Lineus longissimus TaxID=88925 RepID=UPI00315DAA7C
MKLSVVIRGEVLPTLTFEDKEPIRQVGEKALKTYKQKSSSLVEKDEKVYEIRKTRSGAILDPFDYIKQVLNDDDFVSVVLASDQLSPATGPAEGPYAGVEAPEFVIPARDQYMFLDGNNLTTDDLIRLGKGKFRIKLCTASQLE